MTAKYARFEMIDTKTPLLQMQQYLSLVDYVMVFVLEQDDWRVNHSHGAGTTYPTH